MKSGDAVTDRLPVIYLARHGETAWTLTHQHTGMTDLPLTDAGERNAARLGKRLQGITFTKVFTSPLQRALGLMNSLVSQLLLKSTRTSSSGIMASMRAEPGRKSVKNGLGGNFSVTVVPEAKHLSRWHAGRTASSMGWARWMAMCCSSQVDTSSAYWRAAGLVLNQQSTRGRLC
jgi:hypothetical protein